MTRAQTRQFIESGFDGMPNGAGRLTEFNSERMWTYPMGWLEELRRGSSFTQQGLPIDNWQVVIHIAKKDAQDSSWQQYEQIVDECDLIAKQLQKNYNDVVSGHHLVTITGITSVPFYKKNADVLTGVILSFTLSVPDQTNLC